MPISGQTPLTTITLAKDQKITYQPVLLAQFVMPDGVTTLYLASENFDAAEGGPQYKGNNIYPRIQDQSLGALSSIADNGIVQMPQITLKLADADRFLFTNYENPDTLGFKGAILTLLFAFWDADTSTFSSDQQIKFIGVCNAPSPLSDTDITITVNNRLQLANFLLPSAQISQLCINNFPVTAADRLAAATDPTSAFYGCGYSADQSDPAAVGNNGLSGVYTSCPFTFAACIDRLGDSSLPTSSTAETTPVQIEQDQRGRRTARFSGSQYGPPDSWRSRNYTSGSWSNGVNDPNTAKYSGYYPMTWGTAFVSPPVMNVIGDANFTNFEVVLGLGEITTDYYNPGPIKYVIVNDMVLSFSYPGGSNDLSWGWVSGGGRNGRTNKSVPWNGQGDPYGGLICIKCTVPIQVQASNAIPNVQVLFDGPAVAQYLYANDSGPGTPTYGQTKDAAWNLLDILFTCTLTEADVDIASFSRASGLCEIPINYTDLLGNAETHPRYQLGLSLRERVAASQVVTNVLASMKGMLTPNAGISGANAGQLQLFIKQTLADQQGNPVPGSNDNVPYPSIYGNDTQAVGPNGQPVPTGAPSSISNPIPAPGYFAYSFDESNILRKGPERDSPSTFTITQRPITDCPNRVTISFQDEDNVYAPDTLDVSDSQDISRSQQTIVGGNVASGVVNYDQARRCVQTQFAEQFRGNPRTGTDDQNDTGGTWIAQFDASFRAIHLKVGDIISISKTTFNLVRQPFRVISISPAMDFKRITIRAQWHEDDWYLDSYGQSPAPTLKYQQKQMLLRPPFGWLPNTQAPWSGDTIFDPTDLTFGLCEVFDLAPDGTPIPQVQITGCLPVNTFSSVAAPPFCPVAESSNGGSIPAGTYYACVGAIDATGALTPASWPPAIITVQLGSEIVIPNIYWQGATIGWNLYAGTDPNNLSLQLSGTGTPSSITLSSYKVAGQAMPDVMFDHLDVRVKKEYYAGVWGLIAQLVTANTIAFAENWGFDATGRTMSVLGIQGDVGPQPILDFVVQSQAAGPGGDQTTIVTLTMPPGTDLISIGVSPGDVIACRTSANIASATTIGDSKFVSSLQYTEPSFIITDASNTTPIVLTMETAVNWESSDTVQVASVMGNTAANGKWVVTMEDSTHAILNGTSGNGAFDVHSNAFASRVTTGLEPDFWIGDIVMIIAGTGVGQQRSIISNDRKTFTVDSAWSTIPDATSMFIIVDSQWMVDVPTSPTPNGDPTKQVTVAVPINNWQNHVLWTQVYTVAANGATSINSASPGRDMFFFGQGVSQKVITADYNAQQGDIQLNCDTSNGSFTITLLPSTTILAYTLTIIKISNDPNTVTIVIEGGGTFRTEGSGEVLSLILASLGENAIIQAANN